MEIGELENILLKLGAEQLVLRNENFHCCCFYHQERRPSWGISVHPPHLFGCYACASAGDLKKLLIDIGHYSFSQANAIVGDIAVKRRILKLRKETKPSLAEDGVLLLYDLPREKAVAIAKWRGLSEQVLYDAGCRYNHHDDAVIFPWYFNKELRAITARTMGLNNSVKTLAYGNSKKGETLYLPAGRIDAGELILVEGEFDALKVTDAGFSNVGALGFGNVTDHVISQIINSSCDRVVLFFDSDSTGRRLVTDFLHKINCRNKLSPSTLFNFSRRVRTRIVAYSSVAGAYAYGSKLDPGMLSRQEIQLVLRPLITLTR